MKKGALTPRLIAKNNGQSQYFTGKPCKHGHIAKRFVKDGTCVTCKSMACQIWRSASKEHLRERTRAWAKAHPERIKFYYKKNYAKKLATQRVWRGLPAPTRQEPERCEICDKPKGSRHLALDHCHESGSFRGWLCFRCNRGLGIFQDNRDLLVKAAEYLKAAEG